MSVREEFIKQQTKIENYANNGKTFLGDSLIEDGDYGFNVNALELVDPKLYQPLYRYFWQIALPIRYGGGVKDLASFYKINYSNGDTQGQASGNMNVFSTIKIQLEKISTRVVAFAQAVEVGQFEGWRADAVGLDLVNAYQEGAAKKYNKFLDQTFFFGFPNVPDSYGIANSPLAGKESIASETEKFNAMSATKLFTKINTMIMNLLKECDFDERISPDRLLVPFSLFTKLALPMAIVGTDNATATTGISLFEYLKKNLAKNYAGYVGNIDIIGIPYLETAGANSTGRIIAYRYSEEVARGVICMELTRGATVIDPGTMGTKTSFAAFIGEPQIIYPSAIRYLDNKA